MVTHTPAVFSARAGEGRPAWWKPPCVLALAVAAMLVGNIPLIVIAHRSEAVRQRGIDVAGFTPEVAGLTPQAFLFFTLLPFVLAVAILLLAVWLFERRGWRTLLTGARRRPRYRRLLTSCAAWLLLAGISDALLRAGGLAAFAYAVDWDALLPVALVALALIPFQIAFEELSTRGYVHQVVSWYGGRPLYGVLASSILFAALHLGNPEVVRFGLWPMMLYYGGVALFLGLVTVLDDGLELAVGIHLATNIYAVIIVNHEGSALPMPSAWTLVDPAPALFPAIFVARALVFGLLFARSGSWRLLALFRPILRRRTPNPSTA